MKTVPASITTELNKKVTTLARIIEIHRLDGVNLYYTDFQKDLVVNGVTFEARAGVITSSSNDTENVQVPNMMFKSLLDSSAIAEVDIIAGRYDDATIRFGIVDYLAAPTNDFLTFFQGFVGKIKKGDNTFEMEVLGDKQKYLRQYGRRHNETCDVELFGGTRCGVNAATYTFSGTITASTDNKTFSGNTSQVDGYFDNGVITMTSGENIGIPREIYTHLNGDNFVLTEGYAFQPQIGDTYDAVSGCDRRASTCKTKFNNLINFRGFAATNDAGNDVAIIPGTTKRMKSTTST